MPDLDTVRVEPTATVATTGHSTLYSPLTLHSFHTALFTLSLCPSPYSPSSTYTFCSILHTYLLLCYLQFAINSRAESTQCWAPFRRTPLTHCTPIRIRSKCHSWRPGSPRRWVLRTADNNEKMSYVIDFVCSYLHLMWLPFSQSQRWSRLWLPWQFPQAVNKLTSPLHTWTSPPPCLWWVMKLPAGRKSS